VPNRLIIEADGGSRGNPGPAAYGVVVREARSGQVLAERGRFLGEVTNNVAEYSGLVAGLETALEINPTAFLDIRMDSRLVVQQMLGHWKIKHEDMRTLATRARSLLTGASATFTWVPRAENAAADALVNEAIDARGEVARDFELAVVVEVVEVSGRGSGDGSPGGPAGGSASGPADGSPGGPGDGSPGGPAVGPEDGHAGGPAEGRGDGPADGRGEGPADGLAEGSNAGEGPSSSTGSERGRGSATGEDPETGELPPSLDAPERWRRAGSQAHLGRSGRYRAFTRAKPTTVLLARHGVSTVTDTEGEVFSGSVVPGPPLSQRGREQAEALGALVERVALRRLWPDVDPPIALLTSPTLRARQTAQAVGEAIGLDAVPDYSFVEANFGDWDSWSTPQVEERWPRAVRRWFTDPDFHPEGGGESQNEVYTRVKRGLTRVVEAYPVSTIVVVSHAIAIRAALGVALGAPAQAWMRFRVAPASLTAMHFWPAGETEVLCQNWTLLDV
jgi:probable phosphoglycerate mutase